MRRFVIFLLLSALLCVALYAWAAGSFTNIGLFLVGADPVWVVTLTAIGLVITSFLAGLIGGEYSWVDRLWSIAPVLFVWFYAVRAGLTWPTVVAALLIAVWGIRLTYNFARKGGYTTTEDYRWAVLRAQIPNRFWWQMFNLGFIAAYQIGLFVLFTLPMAIVAQNSGSPTAGAVLWFWLSAAVMTAAIIVESLADEQQWQFHLLKQKAAAGVDIAALDPAGNVRQGFLSSGLFAYSRHPNYFGELLVWWGLYLAGSGLAGSLWNWGLLGPVLLTVLFVGSTIFTENITAAKYDAYRAYQQTASPIIPWFRRSAAKPRPAGN